MAEIAQAAGAGLAADAVLTSAVGAASALLGQAEGAFGVALRVRKTVVGMLGVQTAAWGALGVLRGQLSVVGAQAAPAKLVGRLRGVQGHFQHLAGCLALLDRHLMRPLQS